MLLSWRAGAKPSTYCTGQSNPSSVVAIDVSLPSSTATFVQHNDRDGPAPEDP